LQKHFIYLVRSEYITYWLHGIKETPDGEVEAMRGIRHVRIEAFFVEDFPLREPLVDVNIPAILCLEKAGEKREMNALDEKIQNLGHLFSTSSVCTCKQYCFNYVQGQQLAKSLFCSYSL
jgi:hypothetical protein